MHTRRHRYVGSMAGTRLAQMASVLHQAQQQAMRTGTPADPAAIEQQLRAVLAGPKIVTANDADVSHVAHGPAQRENVSHHGDGQETRASQSLHGAPGGPAQSSASNVGQTEVSAAVAGAAHHAYREAGVAQHEWLTAEDEKVCPICAANEAAGPVTLGLPFPSGDIIPPAHPRCRCTTTPSEAQSAEPYAEQQEQQPLRWYGWPDTSLEEEARLQNKGWATAWLHEARGADGKWTGGSLQHEGITPGMLKPGDVIRTRGRPGHRYAVPAKDARPTDHVFRVDDADPAAGWIYGEADTGTKERVQMMPVMTRVRNLPAASPLEPAVTEGIQRNVARFRQSGGTTQRITDTYGADKAYGDLQDQLHLMKEAGFTGFARDDGVNFTRYATEHATKDLREHMPDAGVLVARNPDGEIAGALNHYSRDLEEDLGLPGRALYVDYLGTTGLVHGAGTALAAEAARLAAAKHMSVVGEPTPEALPFWKKMGWQMDPVGGAGPAWWGWTAEQAQAVANAAG
jgi:SPP1 gp7 family putative phage head morphogenesis protein